MTHAEKLAKDTERLAKYISTGICVEHFGNCRICPLKNVSCGDTDDIKEWLESDIDDTVDMS